MPKKHDKHPGTSQVRELIAPEVLGQLKDLRRKLRKGRRND